LRRDELQMQIMEIKRREILTGRRYFLLNNNRKALELDLNTMRHLEEGRGLGRENRGRGRVIGVIGITVDVMSVVLFWRYRECMSLLP
jgi:hypothetical protein